MLSIYRGVEIFKRIFKSLILLDKLGHVNICGTLHETCGADEDVAIEPNVHLTPTPCMRPSRSLPNVCLYASLGSQKIKP